MFAFEVFSVSLIILLLSARYAKKKPDLLKSGEYSPFWFYLFMFSLLIFLSSGAAIALKIIGFVFGEDLITYIYRHDIVGYFFCWLSGSFTVFDAKEVETIMVEVSSEKNRDRLL